MHPILPLPLHLSPPCPPFAPSLQKQRTPAEQLNSASPRDQQKPTSYPHADSVNVSPEIAERRADLGKDASLGQMQAFDGPAPETINGERKSGTMGEGIDPSSPLACNTPAPVTASMVHSVSSPQCLAYV